MGAEKHRHVWPVVLAVAGFILVGFVAFAASGLAGSPRTPLTPTKAPEPRRIIVPAIEASPAAVTTTSTPSRTGTSEGDDNPAGVTRSRPQPAPEHEVVQPPVREQEGDSSSRPTTPRRIRATSATSGAPIRARATGHQPKTRRAEVHRGQRISHDNGIRRAEGVGRRQATVRRSSADTAHRR